jgi:ABC-2 type transport system permease protein
VSAESILTRTESPGVAWPPRAEVRTPNTFSSAWHQWRAMSARALRSAWSENEYLVAVVMPLVFALGFYLPLQALMANNGIDYAQFLMPIIVLQTAAFTAIAAAQRSALDSLRGMSRRMSTMPVAHLTPFLARMTAATVRSVVSIVAAMLYGTVLGFRLSGGPLDTLLFLLFIVAVGVVFALAGDALGVLARSPERTSQLLALPQLVLGLLSTGFVPESGFPTWAQPFARNQPISLFAATLRGLSEGTLTAQTAVPALIWLAGLTVAFLLLARYALSRKWTIR